MLALLPQKFGVRAVDAAGCRNRAQQDFLCGGRNTQFGERCGIAADFYNRYESDFYLAARDGQNAYRFGIEWSRRRDATTRAPSCITTK